MDDGMNAHLAYQIVSEDGIGKVNSDDHFFIINVENGNLRLNPQHPNMNQSLGEHTLIVQVTN